MFGYVKVYEDELLVRNLKKYKNAYCALCKQIGCYSQIARLMLSYDMVFCVLLSESTIPEINKKCKHMCLKNCRKTCGDETLKYLAAVSIILQYHKLNDDVIDGKKTRKYLMWAIESGYKRAKNEYPEIDNRIKITMDKLLFLESENSTEWDILDNCFSQILYDIFAFSPKQDSFTEIRCIISKHVAAWVYWFDMIQDYEEDRKEGNYNTILYFEEKYAKDKITTLLMNHLSEAETLCELLPFSDEVAIIKNIISVGLPQQMKTAGLL